MTAFLQWGAITFFASTLGIFGIDSPEHHQFSSEPGVEQLPAPSSLDLTCPDDMSVVITEDACSKTIEITAPDIPAEFIWVSYKATYTFLGIPPLGGGSNTDLVPPDPVTVDVTPGAPTSVEFWGGDNVVEYVAEDMGGAEMVCSYSIAVLDGFAPYWVDNINEYTYPGECGIDDAIDDIWLGEHIMSPLDNCCNANPDSPVITDTTHLCGGSIAVTFFVIGYDGSGDESGNADDTPCTLGVNPASALYTDTLWITVNLTDNIPPIIEGAPGPDTISCGSSPVMPDLTASDVCLGNLTDSIDIVVLQDSSVECGNGAINRIIEYQATVDDACGNSDTVSWIVYFKNENDLVVDLGDNMLLCTEDSYILDAGPDGDSYLWSTGQTDSIITVDTTGQYYVTVTSGSCCAIDSISLSFGMDVVLNAQGGELTCDSTMVSLMAGVTTDSYVWTGPNGFMSTEQNPPTSDPGKYYVTATSNEGCSGQDSVVVTQDTIAPKGVTAVPGDVDCETELMQIKGASTTPGVNFQWTHPSGFIATVADTNVRLAGDYTLVVTSPNGCQTSRVLNVMQDISSPVLSVKTEVTTNGFDGVAWVDIEGGQAPYSVLWDTQETTDTIMNVSAGPHSVEITDANGCRDGIEFRMGSQTTICEYGSPHVSIHSEIIDDLIDARHAPQSFLDKTCVQETFESLLMTDSTIHVKTYLYENIEGLSTLTFSGDLETSRAFVFTCEQFAHYTIDSCVGVASSMTGQIELDESELFYYIVVAGIRESTYSFNIEAPQAIKSVCDFSGEFISLCGNQMDDAVSGPGQFDNLNPWKAYNPCYQGVRDYTGGDKLYSLQVHYPSRLTFTIGSASNMGIFIYDDQCRSNQCLSYFETDNDNPVVTDEITLNSGRYRIIVDAATADDNGDFTLVAICDTLDNYPWPDRKDAICYNTSLDSSHQIFFTPTSLVFDSTEIVAGDILFMNLLAPNGNEIVGPPQGPFTLGEDFDAIAYSDILGDQDTCGFVEDETIVYKLTKSGALEVINCTPAYMNDDQGKFSRGAVSNVQQLVRKAGTSINVSSINPIQLKEVQFDDTFMEFTIQSNQNWSIELPDDSWIENFVIQDGQDPALNGNKCVSLMLKQNEFDNPRSDTVFVRFEESGTRKWLILTQNSDPTSGTKFVSWNPNVKVFPNPNSGRFDLKYDFGNSIDFSIVLVNVYGSIIYQRNDFYGAKGIESIQLGDVSPGVYFVQILSEGRRAIKKVIVN